MPRLLFTLTLLLGLTIILPAQQATNERVLARAELSTAEIKIGDQINLTVNISVPPGTEMVGLDPAYVPDLKGLEVLREGKLNTVTEKPELLLQQQFLITTFDTGFVAVPPLPYIVRTAAGLDTVFTNDLLITINTVPGFAADNELAPIKPIIREGRNWQDFWWLYLLLVIAAVIYGFYRYHRSNREVYVPPPPPPPAHVVAVRSLRQLEERELWQQGQTKEYYSELTRILRGYLAGRFNVPALEMTTRQLTDRLRQRADFQTARTGELSQLLQLSDLVKFAKAKPAAELHPESLQRVRTFVEQTAPGLAPPPETPVDTAAPTAATDLTPKDRS